MPFVCWECITFEDGRMESQRGTYNAYYLAESVMRRDNKLPQLSTVFSRDSLILERSALAVGNDEEEILEDSKRARALLRYSAFFPVDGYIFYKTNRLYPSSTSMPLTRTNPQRIYASIECTGIQFDAGRQKRNSTHEMKTVKIKLTSKA